MTLADINFFRRTRKFIHPNVPAPEISSFEEAYNIQKLLFTRDDRNIAWKLGGVNIQTREAFNVVDTYGGPISADRIMQACNQMKPMDFGIQCQGELELLVKLGDVDRFLQNQITIDALINSIAPAIECPASVLSFPKDGIFALIADCCAAGTLIHGDWLQWNAYDKVIHSDQVTLYNEQTVLAKGVYGNLIGGIANIVESFIRLAKKHQLPIKSGDMICTGGITPCVKLPKHGKLKVSFSKLGQFSFTIREDKEDD